MHHPNKANLCHHDELDAKADNKDTDTRMAKMRRTGASEAPSFVMTGYKVFSLRKMGLYQPWLRCRHKRSEYRSVDWGAQACLLALAGSV
jgi:hypothetical protein